jgi:hypothetical protein
LKKKLKPSESVETYETFVSHVKDYYHTLSFEIMEMKKGLSFKIPADASEANGVLEGCREFYN